MKLWSSLLLPAGFLIVLLPKGQEVRSQSTGNCIQGSLDENGKIVVRVVTDCVCDPTCNICGYYGEAVSGPEDCFSCADDLFFNSLYADGSGTCNTTDSLATPPLNSTDDSVSSGGICFMLYQVAGK
jgi:hypothetical protein